MNKFYKGILGAAVLCAGSLTAGADTFTIPATQEEFETWTQVVPEGAESWKLITDNGPDAYASVVTCITDYDSQNPGQMLLVPQEYILKAGAKVKITPTAISACDYDGYYRYAPVALSTADGAAPILGGRGSVYGGKTSLQWSKKPDHTFEVPEDGTYRFGIAVMGQKNFATDPPTFFVKTIDVEPLYDEPAYARWADLRPAAPDPDGNKAVTLTFTWPSLTKAGAELDNVGGMIYRSTGSQLKDATFVADITGIPGSDHTYVDCAENNPETAITEDGQYSYWIRTYYRLGDKKILCDEYPPAARTAWVGNDPAVRPFDSGKAYVEKVNGGFNVHFVKEFIGSNGGPVSAAECRIWITRQRGMEKPVVLTEDYRGDSPFVDNTIDKAGSYIYRIYINYKNTDTAPCTVGPAYNGEARTLPYSTALDTAEDLSLFSIISDGSYTWEYNSDKGCAQFRPSEYISSKSDLMTPPVRLAANTEYQVAFTGWVDEYEGTPVSRTITITYGKSASFDGLSNVQKVLVGVPESDKKTYSHTFTCEEDGEYFIGFEAEYLGSSNVYVDNIEVTEFSRKPGFVTDLKVTPDAGGASKATVSFRLPTLTSGGSELDKVTGVFVYGYTEEEGNYAVELPQTAFAPGAEISVVDEISSPGYHSYLVYTFKDEDFSVSQSEDVWVGADTFKSPVTNAAAFAMDGILILTWDEAETEHGGVVPGTVYDIYRRGACEDAEKIAETPGLEYADTEANDLPYNLYTYSVVARGTATATEPAFAEPLILGDHAELPLQPDFDNIEAFHAWDLSGADHDNGKLTFSSEEAEMSVRTPPFIIKKDQSGAARLDMELGLSNAVAGNIVVTAEPLPEANEANADPIELDKIEISVDTPAEYSKKGILLPAEGKYRLKFTGDTSGLALTSVKISGTLTTGIAEISGSDDALYFTADGLRVERPEAPGVYIRMKGSESTRILVK